MTDAEILAVLDLLEDLRGQAVGGLGIEANDPVWLMSIALLRRHYRNQRITISSLAGAARVPYTTALRLIERMTAHGLVERVKSEAEPKLVFIEPTDTLIFNFSEYGKFLKNRIGASLGARSAASGFVFGGEHLAAQIISRPRALSQKLGIAPPLRLLIKDEPTFLSLERLAPEVAGFLGIELRLEMLGYDDLHARISANALKEASDHDIVALDMPWIGRLAHDGAILPLDRWIKRSGMNIFDFHSAAWAGGRYQGRQMGMPFAPTSELFLYRTDIFERHGLPPPLRIANVLHAARLLHQSAPGLSGIAWNAARGTPLGQTFIQVMAAHGCPPVTLLRRRTGYDPDTPLDQLTPTLDHEPGWHTLDYLRQLARVSPPGIAEMDWSARMAAYRSGSVAMSYEWSSRTASFESDVTSPARGTTGYLPHPSPDGSGNLSPIGGFLLGIPANLDPDRAEAGWKAIRWLTSPEFTKTLIRQGSPANYRHSVGADPEVRERYPVLPVLEQMEQLGQLQIWPRPPIPNMTTLMRVVGEEVHDALWSGRPDREALQTAEARLVPLFEEMATASKT